MTDLAHLGIKVDYEESRNVVSRLADIEEQARATEKATDKLNKQKASDGLKKQSSTAKEVVKNFLQLDKQLRELIKLYERFKNTPSGLTQLRKELNQLDGQFKKSYDAGRLGEKGYRNLAKGSDTFRKRLDEQITTLKKNTDNIKEADNASKQYIATLKQRQAAESRRTMEYDEAATRKKELNTLKAYIIEKYKAIDANEKLQRSTAEQAKANRNASSSWIQLKTTLNKLNKEFNDFKGSPAAVRGMRKSLNDLERAALKSYKAGRLASEGYLDVTQSCDKLKRSLNDLGRADLKSYKAGRLASEGYLDVTQSCDKLKRSLRSTTKTADKFDNKLDELWKRFGAVTLGFTVFYRLINAIEQAMTEFVMIFFEGIKLSGEMASMSVKLATYISLMDKSSTSSADFAENIEKAKNNVQGLVNQSLTSASSLQELNTAYDEFAQHGIMIQEDLLPAFSAFTDLTVLLSRTTGETTRQIRSEISGLLEGQMRATNVTIRALKRMGYITDETMAKLKKGEDVSENLRVMLKSMEKDVMAFQKYMVKADPAIIWTKWKDAMSTAIGVAIQERSELEGVVNVFSEVIYKHLEWVKALQEDEEFMDNAGKAMKLLATGLDYVLRFFEKSVAAVSGFLGLMYELRNVLKIVFPLMAIGTVYNEWVFFSKVLKKLGGVIKTALLGSIPLLINSFKALKNAAGVTLLVLQDLPATFAKISAAIKAKAVPGIALLTGKYLLLAAAIYTTITAMRVATKEDTVPDSFVKGLDSIKEKASEAKAEILELIEAKGDIEQYAESKGISVITAVNEFGGYQRLIEQIEEAQKAVGTDAFQKEIEDAYHVYKSVFGVKVPGLAEQTFNQMGDDFKAVMDRFDKIFKSQKDKTEKDADDWANFKKMLQDVKETEDAVKELENTLSGVSLTFYSDMKEAAEAGNIKETMELSSFATRELQVQLDELNEKYAKAAKLWDSGIGTEKQLLQIWALRNEIEELNKQIDAIPGHKNIAQINEWINEFEEGIEQINQKYDEGSDQWITKTRDFVEKYRALIKTLPELTSEEAIAAVNKFEENLDKTFKTTNKKVEEQVDETYKLFEDMLGEMQSEFSDIIFDMLDGSMDDWEDYCEAFGDIFKRTIADLAAYALQQRIILPVIANAGLGSISTAAAQSIVGGTGGVGGGGTGGVGGGGIPGLGSIGTLADSLGLSGVSSWLSTPIGGYDYSTGAVSPGTAAAGATPMQILGYAGLGSMGYSMLGGALGLPQGGYSGIGSALGGAAGGTYGATASSAMGLKLGSWAGPIGIAIGAIIGGILGSLFGSSGHEPHVWLGGDIGMSGGQVTSSALGTNQWIEGGERYQAGFATAQMRGSSSDREIAEAVGEVVNPMVEAYIGGLNDYLAGLSNEAVNEALADLDISTTIGLPHSYHGEDIEKWLKNVIGTFTESMLNFTNTLFEAIDQDILGAGWEKLVSPELINEIQEEGESIAQTWIRLIETVQFIPGALRRMKDLIEEGLTEAEAYQELEKQLTEVSGILTPAIEAGLSAVGDDLDFTDFREGMITNIKNQMKQVVLAAAKQQFMQSIIQSAFDEVGGLTGLLQSYFGGDIGLSELISEWDLAMTAIEGAVDIGLWDKFLEVLEKLGLVVEDTGETINEISNDLLQSIRRVQAEIRGEDYTLNQISSRYGWQEAFGGVPSGETIRDALFTFADMAPEAIQNLAERFGISTEQLVEDMAYLNDLYNQQTEATEENISAIETMTDALQRQAESIQDQINSVEAIQALMQNILGAGSLAPVQSMAYFENRYQQLYSEAMSGGSREVEIFTDFAQKYLEFAQGYGDYETRAGDVVDDLQNLQENIAGNKTLTDLYEQLEIVNYRLDVINNSLGGTSTDIPEYVTEAFETLFDKLGWEDKFGGWPGQEKIMEALSTWEGMEISEKQALAERYGFSDWAQLGYYMQLLDYWYDDFVEDAPSMAGGGIVSGPESGYTMPVTFHGTEEIRPVDGSNRPIHISLEVDKRQLGRIVIDAAKYDSDIAKQIKKIKAA